MLSGSVTKFLERWTVKSPFNDHEHPQSTRFSGLRSLSFKSKKETRFAGHLGNHVGWYSGRLPSEDLLHPVWFSLGRPVCLHFAFDFSGYWHTSWCSKDLRPHFQVAFLSFAVPFTAVGWKSPQVHGVQSFINRHWTSCMQIIVFPSFRFPLLEAEGKVLTGKIYPVAPSPLRLKFPSAHRSPLFCGRIIRPCLRQAGQIFIASHYG